MRERVARVDTLLERVETIADAPARETALAAVQALVDLYGEGLARVVARVVETCDDAAADAVARAFANDELLAHLLLVHGLHPDELEDRVEQALAGVRPYLKSHGGDVALIGIENGVARVHLSGSCHGCAASQLTLRTMVEDAVRAAAPELAGLESDAPDAAPATASATPPLVPLRSARRSRGHEAPSQTALAT